MTGREIIFLVQESPEGGFEARALGFPIFTQADDLATLKERIRDAVSCHFDEEERPAFVHIHVVHDEVLVV